jgi:hypothetical protein
MLYHQTVTIITDWVILIAFMMEAVCTCETSVYIGKTTQRYIPEDCHFHIYSSSLCIDLGQLIQIVHENGDTKLPVP